MIKFFSNNRIIFYIVNFSIIFLYLVSRQFNGLIIYGTIKNTTSNHTKFYNIIKSFLCIYFRYR